MKTSATNRDIIAVGITATLIILLIFTVTCHNAVAEGDFTLTPEDEFGIPASNGIISFATNGIYTQASLVNDTWNFVNLRLAYSQPLESLEVSAQNCNVTIISYLSFNVTLGGSLLNYRVEGQGKQTFNMGLDPKGGSWSVIFNEVFIGEGEGWNASPDGTLTITGATSNVTLWFFDFPDSLVSNVNANQPLYQHSVAIATAVALALTVTSAIVIRRINQKNENKVGQNGLVRNKQASQMGESEPNQP